MDYSNASHWIEVAHSLGREFAGRAAAHDEQDTFVSANYAALKERGGVLRGGSARIGWRRSLAP